MSDRIHEGEPPAGAARANAGARGEPWRWKTFYGEHAVVVLAEALVAHLSGGGWVDWVSAAAVYAGFCYASIGERMRERDALRAELMAEDLAVGGVYRTLARAGRAALVPPVECARWMPAYYAVKEALWLVVFAAMRAWPLVLGCAVFMLWPVWRACWRRRRPLRASLGLA